PRPSCSIRPCSPDRTWPACSTPRCPPCSSWAGWPSARRSSCSIRRARDRQRFLPRRRRKRRGTAGRRLRTGRDGACSSSLVYRAYSTPDYAPNGASDLPIPPKEERAMTRPLSRRRFLQGAAGAGLLAAAGPKAFGRPSDDRLRLAVIGHLYNAGHFFSSIHGYEEVELVAICDPEEKKIADVWKEWEKKVQAGDKAAAYYKRLLDHKPAAYSDFRKMFEAEKIDAVVVSVYDHLHGPICGAAMRAGKHVFSERPLGLTIREARAMRELAAKQKVATSIRNPGNSYPQFRRAVELIREGAIGPVEEV